MTSQLCLCGCGNVLGSSCGYIRGHNRKGLHWTIGQREKIPKLLKGKLKGRALSFEHKRKISIGSKKYYTTHPNPMLGATLSDETKLKISTALKGNKLSDEHKKKISKARLGKTLSLESRKKISLANKGKRIGEQNPFYGKHHSDETREKLSHINKKKRLSEETKKKIGNKLRGRKFSDEFKKKCSLSKIGNKSRLGMPHSEEAKRKIKQSNLLNKGKRGSEEFRKGCSFRSTILWSTPEYIMLQMRSRGVRPNNLEKSFDKLLQNRFPNNWKYVGDGQVVIGKMVPDWININGKKQIIEFFGDYWHKDQNPQDRIDKFAKFGFDCLVIWEHDLKDKTSEELTDIIREFNSKVSHV